MPADLRPATSADLPVIHGLILETGLSTDPTLITATLDGSSYWLATEAGQVVGTVGLEHGDGAGLLRSAAVRPAAQGRGWVRRSSGQPSGRRGRVGTGPPICSPTRPGRTGPAWDLNPFAPQT
ncbi:GNAT family N-acetyltransferase [Deinococcus aquaticus]|uniref:GNAT family N-acetyltransferase n=1 Tax=Deinococcus aquaticus TaxID=328692 RepID=UPI003607F9ED